MRDADTRNNGQEILCSSAGFTPTLALLRRQFHQSIYVCNIVIENIKIRLKLILG